jgi:hypothetical protein
MRRHRIIPALRARLSPPRLALLLSLWAAPTGSMAAQTVSPPIAEYQERARSSFQLFNGSIFPLTAVLEIRGFQVTEQGDVVDVPLDTTRVQVKLSAMSFRIPPRGSYTVFYEARADSTPAWFNILSALSGARTESGLNVRILLPHVVYLNQKQALARAQVTVGAFELDSARGRLRVRLENGGPNLGRVLELTASKGELKSAPGPGFPLFPHSRRWTELTWSHGPQPDRLIVRFAKFTLDTLLSPNVTAPSVPVDTTIMAQSSDAPAR